MPCPRPDCRRPAPAPAPVAPSYGLAATEIDWFAANAPHLDFALALGRAAAGDQRRSADRDASGRRLADRLPLPDPAPTDATWGREAASDLRYDQGFSSPTPSGRPCGPAARPAGAAAPS